ncbi:ATP-grasp domain-containing protein [Candidatus Woesearchaeota archaeon]|nr:ATP-grasp domain-containing protein [Candidatus Woesearchaeota archaeon]
MKLAVLCNCYEKYELDERSPKDKFDDMDSHKTISRIRDAFGKKHDVDVIEASPEALDSLRKKRYDFVFNFSEGVEGANRELYFPAVLEMLKIPFTGSCALAIGITFNKIMTKKILSYHNIATPGFHCIKSPGEDMFSNISLMLPWIIKPAYEGSSIGISEDNIVISKEKAMEKAKEIVEKYGQPAMIEEFLEGREFTVCILGNSSLEILPIVEIRSRENSSRMIWDKSKRSANYFDCPPLPGEMEEKIKEMAKKAYHAVGCKDWARIDFRCDKDGKPYVIEINGIAGLSDRSAFPFAAAKAGISFDGLMEKILAYSMERHAAEGKDGNSD